MSRRRYFRAELMWVFGVCAECKRTRDDDKPLLVARLPHYKMRSCERCLRRHRRIEKEHAA